VDRGNILREKEQTAETVRALEILFTPSGYANREESARIRSRLGVFENPAHGADSRHAQDWTRLRRKGGEGREDATCRDSRFLFLRGKTIIARIHALHEAILTATPNEFVGATRQRADRKHPSRSEPRANFGHELAFL